MTETCAKFGIRSPFCAACRVGAQRLPLFSVALLAGFAGCGSSDDAAGKVTVYPVKGKVLLSNGQPLTSGRVVFLPLGELMVESSGTIGPDGSFTLSTARRARVPPRESSGSGSNLILETRGREAGIQEREQAEAAVPPSMRTRRRRG